MGPTGTLRIGEWVLPSRVQADRVAEGSLDLAVVWIRRRRCAGSNAPWFARNVSKQSVPGRVRTSRYPPPR